MDAPRSQIQLTRAIMDAIRDGDRSAFDDLFRRVGGRVYVYVVARMGEALRSVMEPEDLLQEVYAEAYLHFETFEDHGPGSFARWMVGIASNVIRQAYKHHFAAKRRDARRRVSLDDEQGATGDRLATPEATPSRIIARNEGVRRLAAALDSLEEEDRDVVLLRVFEGCSLEEIATRTGKPRTTVAYRLARAVTRLEGQVPDLNTVW